MSLASFNAASAADAEAAMLSCCASRAFATAVTAGRPYASVDALEAAIISAFTALTWDDVLEAMAAHPRIGDRVTGTSAAEQSGVSAASRAALVAGNVAYEERFGHVFLICASGLSGEQMLAALRERMSHTPEAERAVAARELQKITVLRARKLTCTISTHVLDATTGVPAAGVTVVLEALEAADDPADGEWRVAGHGVTDADGRLRFSSAMEGSSESGFAAGEYALTFGTGEYFRRRETRSFYPKVTITFLVTSGHHHVPLLLSPFAYSTYRGS